MKKRFLNKLRDLISKQYPEYSNDKLDEIMYGIEGIYLTITKTIIIFSLAFILGIAKELLFLLITFNIIRLFAFGIHAGSSTTCLIFSSILFLGSAFLCKHLVIDKNIILITYFIIFILICLFSPADTVKRPLIKKKKRIRWKILSIFTVLIYFSITLLINNNLMINSLLFGLLIECILINPITYMLFKLPYNNYKKYGLNT